PTVLCARRQRLLQLRSEVEQRNDRATEGNDAHGIRIGVRNARDRAGGGDLRDVFDVDRILLAAKDKGQQLDFIGSALDWRGDFEASLASLGKKTLEFLFRCGGGLQAALRRA